VTGLAPTQQLRAWQDTAYQPLWYWAALCSLTAPELGPNSKLQPVRRRSEQWQVFKDFLWVPGFLKANPELVERYSVSVMFLRAFIQVGWESIHPGNSMFHTSKWLAICQLIGALKPFYTSILGCASHFAPGS
jgi:hypothetical protein